MKFQLKRKSGKRHIDMTPMIDCVFQLLLFFLVSSHFEEQARMTGEGELDATNEIATVAVAFSFTSFQLALRRRISSRCCGRRHHAHEMAGGADRFVQQTSRREGP